MSCFTQVTITVTNRGEKRDAWFVFETPHKTVEEQIEQMIADGGLRGIRHDTKPADGINGDRQIVDSYATFIDRQIIVSVSELRHGLFSKDGRVLA